MNVFAAWNLANCMKRPLPAQPRHIGILRLSALGDVCNLVPTVRALQRQWPDARITWIIGKGEHSLLAGLSGVEFVVYDKASGVAGMRALWRELTDTRFDVLLHMQQALRASLLGLGLKAGVRVGYDKARAKDAQHWFTHRQLPPHPRAHVVDSFMDFARLLGVEDTRLEWQLSVPDAAYEEARQLSAGRRYLMVSPCSSVRVRNFRNWSAEGFAAVIEHAWQQYGLVTLLTGSGTAKEREMCERITALVPDREALVDGVGQLSLKGLLALIDEAQAVIAPDSGPVHMANALGTPVIGLYATSNLQRTGPYDWRHLAVDRYPQAVARFLHKDIEALGWGERVRHPDAMSLIAADDVIERLDTLLTEPRDET
ncbi:heptosyltransferase I [Franzmannia pantelleriensis]|uniref:Heptosyltransferase I n=2 Tax=Franzmannia pantelleriensis TaxID=48727 RepID=A0A1G9LAG9_9GAMM|nr:heptosyltransferase I [Halomonas pantelleriensis]